MKLITSSVEILPQEEGLLGAYKQIEKVHNILFNYLFISKNLLIFVL